MDGTLVVLKKIVLVFKTDSKKIGRFSIFENWKTLSTFHESGNWVVSMDVLNKKARESPIKDSASFRK